MKRHPEKYGLKIVLLAGIVFYPAFIIMDLMVYPEHIATLIAIRCAVIAGFAVSYLLMDRLKDQYLFILVYLSFFYTALGITLMFFLTKTGFASPYYAGNFLVLMGASVFFRISMKAFVTLISSIILQHFILLLFVPYELQDFFINLFFLAPAASFP